MVQEHPKSKADFQSPRMRGRPGRMPPEESSKITRKITLLSMAVGIIFVVAKFFLLEETHSVAILASLIHSSLDLFAAFTTFIAVRYAALKPDGSFKYGRGKAESFAAVLQVCLIVIVAFHLLEESIETFENPVEVTRSTLAILSLIAFILLSTFLLLAQGWAIRETGSIAVRGDRAHYLSDMVANVFVIAGILFTTYTPFKRADIIVGIIMALWLLFTAVRISRIAWNQLMDKELSENSRNLIIQLALNDPAVISVHDLRTRASGPHIHIQMRLDLDSQLSLSDAHDVVLAAEKRMMQVYKAADILIHPHPTGCQDAHGNERFRTDD